MSTDAIPHINTNDSPMLTARDDSRRITAKQPTATSEVERFVTR
jgi:hypothetical protein